MKHDIPYGYSIVKTVLSDSFSKHQWFTMVLTFFVYAGFHMSRKPLSVVKSVLHANCNDNKLPPTAFGLPVNPADKNWCHWKPFDGDNWSQLLGTLEYAYLFAYSLAMFVSGHIAERTNLRRYLTWGLILSGLSTAAFGFGRVFYIHIFSYYLLVQLFAGFVQATGWPAVVAMMGHWFGHSRRGLIMGIWNSHTSVGNVLGSLLAGMFVSQDWALSFIYPGVIMLLLGILVAAVAIPNPEDVGFPPPSGNPKQSQSTKGDSETSPSSRSREEDSKAISFCDALFIPGVVPFAVALFFAKLVAYTFLYWLPNYLHVVGKNMNPEKAAQLSTVFDFGGILGGIAAGQLSDLSGSNSAATCAAMLALAAPLLFVYQKVAADLSVFSLVLLFVCGSLVNGPYALITTAVSADLGTSIEQSRSGKALATVTAIIDGMGSLGAAMGPLLTGVIVRTGWENVFYMLILSDVLALAMCMTIMYQQHRQRGSGVATVWRFLGLGGQSSSSSSVVVVRQFFGGHQLVLFLGLCVLVFVVWFLYIVAFSAA